MSEVPNFPQFPPAAATTPVPRDQSGHLIVAAAVIFGLCSIGGLLFSLLPAIFAAGWLISLVFTLPAIILGHVGVARAKRDPSIRRQSAVAGYGMGYMTLVLCIPFMFLATAIHSAIG